TLGLQQIAAVKADLDQDHQPAVGTGMGQRLIRMGDGTLLLYMGCRGGDAPVRVSYILDKIDRQPCLVY
ncbi:MAG: hypothetical protein RLZZ616_1148, partial [Pseudomonadota bacterium]